MAFSSLYLPHGWTLAGVVVEAAGNKVSKGRGRISAREVRSMAAEELAHDDVGQQDAKWILNAGVQHLPNEKTSLQTDSGSPSPSSGTM